MMDQTVSNQPILIFIFLRGGCDALNFVAPIDGEDRKIYEQERPTLAMAKTGNQSLIPLDANFGLHPSAQSLMNLYNDKKMAIVHATGISDTTRSHFDAQNIMDWGLHDVRHSDSGWLARALWWMDSQKMLEKAALPAVAVGSLIPPSLWSYDWAVSMQEPHRWKLPGNDKLVGVQKQALTELYSLAAPPSSSSNIGGKPVNVWLKNSTLINRGHRALEALTWVEKQNLQEYQPANGVNYPKADLGNKMKTLAQLLKAGSGIQVASLEMGGWDTHRYQGVGTEGIFANNVKQLSESISALFHDFDSPDGKAIGSRLQIVVTSEFGRRLRENANRGTDHGHGGFMMLVGDKVAGKKVHGNWPGLKTNQLFDRADLAVTTDYRQVLSEVLAGCYKGIPNKTVFPKFISKNHLGLMV